MRRGIRILLVIPLVFNGLVVALSMATVAVPTPAVRVGLFIALTAPLIALPLLLRIGAAAGLVVGPQSCPWCDGSSPWPV